jgi:hypothetical protein
MDNRRLSTEAFAAYFVMSCHSVLGSGVLYYSVR